MLDIILYNVFRILKKGKERKKKKKKTVAIICSYLAIKTVALFE